MELTLIAGKYARKKLRFISSIRPTSTKVRKAVFTVLGEFFDGGTFLDLFAGSGAMGIEALSRGMKRIIFVERDPQVVRLIEKNLKLVGQYCAIAPKVVPEIGCIVLPWGIKRSLKYLFRNKIIADVVYVDPPYSGRWEKMTLKAICEYDILSAHSRLFVEHYKKVRFHDKFCLKLIKTRDYGDTCVSEFKLNEG